MLVEKCYIAAKLEILPQRKQAQTKNYPIIFQ